MTPAALTAMRADAAARAPLESCGLVVDGEYRPCENIAGSPRASFRIEPSLVLEAHRSGLDAIIHSHPHPYPAAPSRADMAAQIAHDVPFGIVPVSETGEPGEPFFWGADTPRPDLHERPYRWGITDCYSLCRDYYHERGIDLPDYPRAWRWWREAEHPDLFLRHFAAAGSAAGFGAIDTAEAAPGDGVLIALDGVVCHAGVIVEPGLLLHHPAGDRPYDPARRPRSDLLARWLPHVRLVVRHRA